MPTNVNIPGGDTVVIISSARQLRVHSHQLVRCSTLFNHLLRAPAPVLSSKGQRVGVRYLIILQNDYGIPELRRIDLDADAKPTGNISKLHEGDGSIDPEVFSSYEKVIGSFFDVEIKFDHSSIDALSRNCIGLVQVAEYLNCVSRISKVIEGALLSGGQKLFRAIANDPLTYLDLSNRLQSRPIFKDALIHTVGRYKNFLLQPPSPSFKAQNPFSSSILDEINPPELRDLVDKKHNQLKQHCIAIEKQVATHYPSGLMKTKTTGRADQDKIGRVSYAKEVFGWIALACYRQWVGQVLASDRSHNAPDNGFVLFSLLAEGGQAYLDRTSIANFHEAFAMSKKGETVMESNLDVIKAGIVEVVKPLMVNNSQVESKEEVGFKVKWLTCVNVREGDYIWEKEESESGEDEEGKGKGKKRAADEAFAEKDEQGEDEYGEWE